MNVPKKMKRALEAESSRRQRDALQERGDEENLNRTAMKRRRLVLCRNFANDHEEEARNRHTAPGTEEQKHEEVHIGEKSNAKGLPQKLSRKRQEAEDSFCKNNSEQTSTEKRRNMRYMDFRSEEEEGKGQHCTTCKQNRTTKINTMAAESLDPRSAKFLKKRDGSRRGVRTIKSLQKENSFAEASTLTKRTQSEPEVVRFFRENLLRNQFSSRVPGMTMPSKRAKKASNQAAEAFRLMDSTSSEPETVRDFRGLSAKQVDFVTDDINPIAKENSFDWLQQKEKEEVELNHFVPKGSEDRMLNPKAESLGVRGNIVLEFLEIGSDGHEERCHKCQKFGELLCCGGCPIAVHLSCLEPLIMKLPEGAQEWFCPVCYEKKAKKRVAQAEQKAVEARAKLDAFIRESSKIRRQSEGCPLPRNKTKNSYELTMHGLAPMKRTYKRDTSPFDIREQIKELLERSALRSERAAAQMATLVRKASRPERWKAVFPESVSCDEDQNNDDRYKHDNYVRATEVYDSDIEEKLRVGKEGYELASCLVGHDVHLHDEGAGPTGAFIERQESSGQHARAQLILEREARTGKDLPRGSARNMKDCEEERIEISKAATERQQSSDPEHSPLPPHHPAENFDVESEDGGRRSATGEAEGEKHDDASDKASDDKMKERFSKLVLGGRRRVPGLRRKVLRWTRDEEDALKEGVQKYSHDGCWGLQWTRILEYGMGRFDSSRTAVDLKDKWRNLLRDLAYAPTSNCSF